MEWVRAGTCLEATFSQQAPHCNWEGTLERVSLGSQWRLWGAKGPPEP